VLGAWTFPLLYLTDVRAGAKLTSSSALERVSSARPRWRGEGRQPPVVVQNLEFIAEGGKNGLGLCSIHRFDHLGLSHQGAVDAQTNPLELFEVELGKFLKNHHAPAAEPDSNVPPVARTLVFGD
jgi:hypothetical protein